MFVRTASTHPAYDCLNVKYALLLLPDFSQVQPCFARTCQFSENPCHLPSRCLNTFKSFLLMQGTIKLSNGHNHYVKGQLHCQQFEHCLIPGRADEMSEAQYFKAINLSAFLFSLITF